MATPYFTNSTPIAQMDTRLAGSIGDRLGAGIQQAAQGFAAGIERKRAAERKKQEDEQALMFIKQVGPQIGMGDLGDDDIRAGIKGLGGGSEVMKLAMQIQQAQSQNRLMQARATAEENDLQEQVLVKEALPKVLSASYAASETGQNSFDTESFISGMTASGVRPDTALKYAQVFQRNPEAAVQFIQNPNTGENYAQMGKTLIREPAKDEKSRKAGDVVIDPASGREVIWSPSPGNIIDKETGEPLYIRGYNPEIGQLSLIKNPAIFGAAATGKVEIPDDLFGNVNF